MVCEKWIQARASISGLGLSLLPRTIHKHVLVISFNLATGTLGEVVCLLLSILLPFIS